MNKELQDKLYDRFPDLYRQKDLPMSADLHVLGL